MVVVGVGVVVVCVCVGGWVGGVRGGRGGRGEEWWWWWWEVGWMGGKVEKLGPCRTLLWGPWRFSITKRCSRDMSTRWYVQMLHRQIRHDLVFIVHEAVVCSNFLDIPGSSSSGFCKYPSSMPPTATVCAFSSHQGPGPLVSISLSWSLFLQFIYNFRSLNLHSFGTVFFAMPFGTIPPSCSTGDRQVFLAASWRSCRSLTRSQGCLACQRELGTPCSPVEIVCSPRFHGVPAVDTVTPSFSAGPCRLLTRILA